MFPITHIWFSKKVLGYVNDMTVFGSIFPDTVTNCCLTHDQSHTAGWELFDYFNEQSKEHVDFAKAWATHAVNPKGLDFYGDNQYEGINQGYCFQKAFEIEEEVIAACNIPENIGLWKAHNFIEMGIEMNISESHKELVDSLYKGIRNISMVREISSHLDKYFGLKDNSIAGCFYKFTGFLELEDVSSIALARRYNRQMESRHDISIDILKCSSIIEKSRRIVSGDYEDFIGYCINNVGNMMKEKINGFRNDIS